MNKYLPIISTPIYFLEKNLLNKIVKEMKPSIGIALPRSCQHGDSNAARGGGALA